MNTHPDKTVQVISLGLTDYMKAWEYQEKLFREIIAIKLKNRELSGSKQTTTPNYLVFCEHPHVYTLGKSGLESNLLLDKRGLEEKDAQYYKINRGGDITYHGPGQLVCYPVLDLDNFFEDIHKYLRLLEQAVIDTLAEISLQATRIPGLTGVWINVEKGQKDNEDSTVPRKICAMGVRTSRWVTMHGLALNVCPDLDYFNNIIPCGINDKDVTSIARELNDQVSISKVEKLLAKHLGNQFQMSLHHSGAMDIRF